MARARGNARKKKVRLTDHTAATVMEIAPRRAPSPRPEATAEPDSALFSSFSLLDLLRAEPDAVAMPAAYNELAHIFTGAGEFPTTRFVFGVATCPHCRNEMVYYQERAILAAGYHFRCRVCQQEMLASLD